MPTYALRQLRLLKSPFHLLAARLHGLNIKEHSCRMNQHCLGAHFFEELHQGILDFRYLLALHVMHACASTYVPIAICKGQKAKQSHPSAFVASAHGHCLLRSRPGCP